MRYSFVHLFGSELVSHKFLNFKAFFRELNISKKDYIAWEHGLAPFGAYVMQHNGFVNAAAHVSV
jgi:hypothetical protein